MNILTFLLNLFRKESGGSAGRSASSPASTSAQTCTGCRPAKSTMLPIDIARSLIGTREIPGTEHNSKIVGWLKKLAGWVEDDETAWCSAFANHCAKEAGYERSGKLDARSWLKVGEEISLRDAKKGDVVILWRGSKTSWEGHVAFLDYYNRGTGQLYLLGGNQSNEVNITTYPVERLLGVRRLRSLDRMQGNSGNRVV